MRHLFPILLIAALAMQSCGVTHRMESRPVLSVTPSRLDLVVDQSGFPYTVNVNYLLTIPRGYVTTCAQLVVTPYFTDGTNMLPLTPLFVSGRTFNRVERRRERLGQEVTNYDAAVKFVATRGDMAVEMNETIDFQPWMTSSELVLATSCVACDRATVLSQMMLAKGMEYMPPSLGPVIIVPAPAPVPFIVKESWSAHLSYPINRFEILPELGTNARQLADLNAIMTRIMADSSLHVTMIVACGMASPDGVAASNLRLAQERAASLKNYIVAKYGVDPAIVDVKYVAEDWLGLRELLEKSSLTGREKLIADLDACTNDAQREKVMRSSPLFSYIRTNFLPQLRRVVCDIYYNKVK